MIIKRNIYPGAPPAFDVIVKGDTVVWTLNCQVSNNAVVVARNLTGLTNYLGVLRDSLQNPCTAMTDATAGSNIVVTNAAQGILTVTLTGSWTLPFMPGNWTLTFTAMDSSNNVVVLGKRDITLIEQTGGVS